MIEQMPKPAEKTTDKENYDPAKVLENSLVKIKEMEGFGKNVTTIIEFSRHATTEGAEIKGALAPKGEEEARELGKTYPEDASRVVGFGSSLTENGFQRALDTVDIALKSFKGITGEGRYPDLSVLEKMAKDLDFTKTKNKWPAQKDLEGKSLTIDQRMNGAPELTREVASKIAHWVKFCINSSLASKDGEKNFYPIVSHFIMSEAFLKHCMLRIDKEGNRVEGFENTEDIGGSLGAAEPFDMIVQTGDNKEIKEIKLVFKNPERAEKLKDFELFIDMNKLDELDKDYDKYEQEEKK